MNEPSVPAPDGITVLPAVKPWEQRRNSVPHLAGGAKNYLGTLAWILRQCQDGFAKTALVESYRGQFELSVSTASVGITDLVGCGFLQTSEGVCRPSDSAGRWLVADSADIAIGTLHAHVRFIGELLDLAREACSKQFLLQSANDSFGFKLKTSGRLDFRLAWLLSANFIRRLADSRYQTTDAGIAFLERVELYRPTAAPAPVPDESPSDSTDRTAQHETRDGSDVDAIEDRGGEAAAPGTKLGRSARDVAAEIGDRLESLSCDGAKHQEFEVAVRDAFAFLGFSAERLSGSGQTDVLLAAIRPPAARRPDDSAPWSYKVAIDAKAVTNGALGDGQVSFPALALHRERHAAAFSVLVGPSPRPRLLQFAAKASVAVLSAEQLAGLCRDHADVPLPVADYFWLFADSEGGPQGGAVDLGLVVDARAQATACRDLLAQVGKAVHDIAADFGPANRQLVRFSLATNAEAGGDALSVDVAEALDFLSSSWLRAIARADPGSADPHYVSTAPGRTVAARLRWLADAFDEAVDQAGETPETD